GNLLQDLGAGPAQPALDLAEIRVGYPRRRGKLPQRDLGLLSLLADVLADGAYVHGIHAYSESNTAWNCKRPASTAMASLRRHASPAPRSALSRETAPQIATYQAPTRPLRVIRRQAGPGLAWNQDDPDSIRPGRFA